MGVGAALLLGTLVASSPCAAYVGPGPGISVLAALAAVVLGILLALGGLLAWPVRTYIRHRKKRTTPAHGSESIPEAEGSSAGADLRLQAADTPPHPE